MKTLFPKQKEAADFFIANLKEGQSTLDASAVGTGKTVVAAAIAKDLECPVAVICPKAVIPSWERELTEMGVDPLFILNYEKLRTGKTSYMSKTGKKIIKWNLPEGTIILMDEIQKAKGPYTINAQMLISLIQQGYRVHGMSATAAEDPTEMRPLGYMLKLHSLNKTEGGKLNWYSWMMRNGCKKDHWGSWKVVSRERMARVRDEIFGETGHRLTVEDFPDSFRNNRVFQEPVQFSSGDRIAKAYEDLGITPSIIEEYVANGSVTESEHAFVNILRSRQLAESFKAPDLAEMAEDLIKEGNSVVIFVNFRETVDALTSKLKCGRIDGGQSADERQKIIDDFQQDKAYVVVANIAAGGTGLSLHDINGNRPRVSLICPTFNAKEYVQTLGRIFRNGAKSDSLQKILIAANSVEENVMTSINNKLKNLDTLYG
tara:strand:- start:7730 stop:9022 length:1293 start_codon:yes stop_codon:yes gene_type:complete